MEIYDDKGKEKLDYSINDLEMMSDSDIANISIRGRPSFFRKPEQLMVNISVFILAWYMRKFMSIENDIEYYLALYMPYIASGLLAIQVIITIAKKRSTLYISDRLKIKRVDGFLSRKTESVTTSELSGVNIEQTIMQRIIGIGDISIEGSSGSEDFRFSGVWNPGKVANTITRVAYIGSTARGIKTSG